MLEIVVGGMIALSSSLITLWFQARIDRKRWEEQVARTRQESLLEDARKWTQLQNEKALRNMHYGGASNVIYGYLNIRRGPDTGLRFPINRYVSIIGTSANDCDLRLTDPEVAGFHLRLIVADETLVLEDISLGKGVLINAQEIIAPKVLHDKDQIRIGETNIEISVKQ